MIILKSYKMTIKRLLELLQKFPVELLTFGFLLLIYSFLFSRYLLNDIDDTWTTAWVYYFIHDNTTQDIVFQENNPNYWGVRFFSHIFCYVYGSILLLIGFTRDNVHLISNFFGLGTLWCWYQLGKKVFSEKKDVFVFLLLLASSTLFFASANKGRSDMFVFFFMSLALWLFSDQKYFFSALAACIAIETHPIGGLVFGYMAAYAYIFDKELLRLKKQKGMLPLIAGGLLGLCGYVGLHFNELSNLRAMFDALPESSNFLYEHFFGRNSFRWRYWPDLFIFIAAGGWAIYRSSKRRQMTFPLLASLFLVAGSFAFRRSNFHYALFCYPAFLMLAVESFGSLRWKNISWLLFFFLGVLLPQYGYLCWKNGFCRDYRQYQKAVGSFPFPGNSLIYGHPADWFALQKYRTFRSLTEFQPPDREFYLIEHDGTRYAHPDLVPVDKTGYYESLLKQINLPSGGTVRILKLTPLEQKTMGRQYQHKTGNTPKQGYSETLDLYQWEYPLFRLRCLLCGLPEKLHSTTTRSGWISFPKNRFPLLRPLRQCHQ